MKKTVTIFPQYASSQISVFAGPILLAGTKHGECQSVIRKLQFAEELDLIPDPSNEYDNTAVKVCTKKGLFVGWVPGQNEAIFTALMKGITLKGITAEMLLPNKDYDFYNVKIQVFKIDNPEKKITVLPVLKLANRDYDDRSRIYIKAQKIAVDNNLDWDKIYNQLKDCYTDSLFLLKLSKHFDIR